MRNNPFGLPESAIDRFVREERERAEMFRTALGGSAIIEAARQAHEHRRLLRAVDISAAYRGMVETLKVDAENREAFKLLASNAWALSVQETARTIAEQRGGLVEQQRHLAGTALETIRSFDLHRSTIGAALTVAGVGESYRRMIAETLPRFSAFGVIAERMLMVDRSTLRASEDGTQSATELAARTVIEAQRIAEAIAGASNDEEGARLYGSLLDLLVEFFSSLGPNTIPALRKMGLVDFAEFIFSFLGLALSVVALMPRGESQSPQDKAAFAQLNEKIDELEEETRQYCAADADADQAYAATLPRAQLARGATLHRTPARDGEVVLKASKGAVVAVAEVQGSWRLVVYRDPLSNQLARAWASASVLTSLTAPIEEDGE